MKESIIIAVAVVVAIFGIDAARATDHKFAIANNEELKLELDDGTKTPATFFHAGGKQAVVFVPGGVGTKESYHFLARRLQKIDIASLTLDGRSESALLSAIDYLRKKGFGKLSLVGGSIGASTILITVKYSILGTPRDIIGKVVLISPYGGSALQSEKIKKLFIASKEDSLSPYTGVENLYNDTSNPKTLKVYEGSAHAEQFFEDLNKEDIAQLIVDFLRAK